MGRVTATRRLAALLAERTPPSYALLRDALLGSGRMDGGELRPPGAWWCDWFPHGNGWRHFVTDYPEAAARAADFPTRLTRALEPVLAEADQPGDTTQTRWARWLVPLTEAARAEAEPAVALGRLAEGGQDGLTAAIVVLRELRGPAAVSPEEALHALLAADDGWRVWREHPGWWPELLARLP
ncbi:hypothetical protein RM844_02950 [Streptomyces sp. DSM 44915]|uniref:Uncharacterized protein n=1 Tax=Streptomyces chisholmiae TaxID=3075540 RepID=A0ABU2JJT6_9ACTN|nr:hypothetical protein [Streptomyces sp. DSM 44915]MDT0265244.1 hypothetical protein [Streptomyces sp. DSM 44915]